MQYTADQQDMLVSFGATGIEHAAPTPVIGIDFDVDATPMGSPFPYGDDVTFTGDVPEKQPVLFMEPFGLYFGQVWWVRLPAVDHSYSIEAHFNGDYVDDHQPLDITGRVRNQDGIDTVSLSLRASTSFRNVTRGRISYRPPDLEPPAAVPALASPQDLKKLPNGEPTHDGLKACSTLSRREVLVTDDETIDDQGRLGPLYSLDTAVPKPSVDDALQWTTDAADGALSPVASVLDRDTEQSQQVDNTWVGILAGTAVPTLVYGFRRAWKSVSTKTEPNGPAAANPPKAHPGAISHQPSRARKRKKPKRR